MDEIDRLRHDEFELEHLELSLGVVEAFEEGPRYSPGARRFMAGEMSDDEARQRGYLRRDVGDDG